MRANKAIEIRTARQSDLDGILELDHKVWVNFPASREMIAKRLAIFPEGNIIAIDKELGEIVGYLCLMFLEYEPIEFPNTWMDITGDGTTRTHNPEGKYMYGVALTVAKGYSVGMELQVHGWVIGIKYRRRGCYLGSPIPRFAEYLKKHSGTTVEDYVFRIKASNSTPYDPELAYYYKAGFKAVRILPNYEPDPKSLDHGVLVYCSNIFYHWPFRALVAWLVKKFGFRLLKALGV
ncbi:MAG: hypothetical protein NTZ18_04710 [Candidatus Komeilibacteria bacterium]|nr:hypothetical protein [Candidatus Komeilibacteria bacterium]